MASNYDHLGLTRWPFPVVPDREFCTFLAGRSVLQEDLNSLLSHMRRRDTSSIHVMWSWFGAGKTHSLYYVCNEAEAKNATDGGLRLIPVYTEFPKGARSFIDLYRAFMSEIDLDTLSESYLEVCTAGGGAKYNRALMRRSPDLANALRVLATGDDLGSGTAARWLRGDDVPIADLRKIGVSQKINVSDLTTRIVNCVVSILAGASFLRGEEGVRVIWIIDELQRVKSAGAAAVRDVNAGLHSTFNATPKSMSFMLSFSGQPEPKKLPDWFSPELRDRIGATKIMILPPLASNDATEFVLEVLRQFRTDGHDPTKPYFPFTEKACRFILQRVAKQSELRPRAIFHAFNAVLQETDLRIEEGEISEITPKVATAALEGYVFVSDNPEGG